MTIRGSMIHVPTRSRKAFTTVLVIATMLFVGGAIAGMSSLFAHEIARTRAAKAEIQLRQILLAAGPAARQELAANGSAARDVAIPVPLGGASLALQIAPTDESRRGAVKVIVIASFNHAQSSEILFFSADYGLTSAALLHTQGQ